MTTFAFPESLTAVNAAPLETVDKLRATNAQAERLQLGALELYTAGTDGHSEFQEWDVSRPDREMPVADPTIVFSSRRYPQLSVEIEPDGNGGHNVSHVTTTHTSRIYHARKVAFGVSAQGIPQYRTSVSDTAATWRDGHWRRGRAADFRGMTDLLASIQERRVSPHQVPAWRRAANAVLSLVTGKR
jgi:hypothetical protein